MPPFTNLPTNVILTGFMGTGKSTVGRRLAQQLGWRFVDTDDLIEREAGKTITRIFAEDGEPFFRNLETQIAKSLAQYSHYVIATGGGLVLRPENLAALERAGRCVLLDASAETIYERTKRHTHRPLLQGPDPRGNIQKLLDQRRDAYGRIQTRIATDDRSHEQVVEAILSELQAAESKS